MARSSTTSKLIAFQKRAGWRRGFIAALFTSAAALPMGVIPTSALASPPYWTGGGNPSGPFSSAQGACAADSAVYPGYTFVAGGGDAVKGNAGCQATQPYSGTIDGPAFYGNLVFAHCDTGTYTSGGCIQGPDQGNDPQQIGSPRGGPGGPRGPTAPAIAGTSGGPPQCSFSADPIVLSTGDLLEWATDYQEAGVGLRFDRGYSFRHDMPTQGAFGSGWRGPNDRTALTDGAGNATIYLEGGQSFSFQTASGAYVPTGTRTDGLAVNNAGDLVWTSATGDQTTFSQIPSTGSWSLKSIKTQDGGSLDFIYAGSAGTRTLATMVDGAGRSVGVTWTNGLISRLSFPDGSRVDYAYNPITTAAGLPQNALTTVTRSLGSDHRSINYLYEDTTQPNALTGMTDERGVRSATWTWDDTAARVTSSKIGGGAQLTSISYDDTAMTRTVTNALGRSEVHQFTFVGGAWQQSAVTGNATVHCPASVRSATYASGLIDSQTNEIGTQTTYVRDALGRETSRTEAAGSTVARTIGTVWSIASPAPSQVTTPLNITDLTYTPLTPISNGTSTDPHRYWRLNFNGDQAGSGVVAMGEIEAVTRLGDSNLLNSASVDSTPSLAAQHVNQASDGQYGVDRSADNRYHNFALSALTGAVYLDFGGTPRVLNHVTITGLDPDFIGSSPTNVDVQYSETGGVGDGAWSTAWSITGQTGWTEFQRRTFTRPGYTDAAYVGSPHGTHRFWRVLMLDEVSRYYTYGLSEVEFRATPGGSDQTGSGTPLESSEFVSGYTVAKAFDKNSATLWASARESNCDVCYNEFVGYDFGSGHAVSVAQVLLQSRTDDPVTDLQMPSIWMLQYSDDGVIWNTASQFTDTAAWGSGEVRLYTDPLYVAP